MSGGRFTVSPASPLSTFEALLDHLAPPPGRVALLLLEDIDWADDSTLDLLRYLGRRIRTAPILVVVTFRNDEPASQARLAALWADIPRDARERMELQRLTPAAVQELAGRVPSVVASDLYAATGGNPFHVTEYLAARPPEVPASVREATLARAAALCPYEQAIALCFGDEAALRSALAIFDELGATPAAARLRRELRARGVREIPRGPNAATRANPLGLTARQQDVLDLLLRGFTNARIARQLGISPKTTEHHVSAILALLGARTRTEVVRFARARGLAHPGQKQI